MPHLVRPTLILVTAVASVLGVAAYALAPAQAENTLEIVVGNRPYAGTYKPPAESIICLHDKKEKRYTAAWKDFDRTTRRQSPRRESTFRIPTTREQSMARYASRSEIRTRSRLCIASTGLRSR